MRTTWVVVADGSRARILRALTVTGKLAEVEILDHPPSRAKARDLVEDGPTTVFSSVGNHRSAVNADSAPQFHEQDVFARAIAERLAQARFENRFEKLVLMAPAQFLGTLRQALGPSFAKLIVQTVSKDLTKMPLDNVGAYLEPTAIAL
jgi:protein required for attachment to host cells